MQAGIVEEIVEHLLAGTPIAATQDAPRRNGVHVQFVVHAHRDPVRGSWPDERRDVGLEGRIAALVTGDFLSVEPDDGPVGGRLEAQHDPLAVPSDGNDRLRLVPGIADVVADLRVGEHVVVGGGHGDLARGFQRLAPPPVLAPASLRIDTKAPETVQRFQRAFGVLDRFEHDVLPVSRSARLASGAGLMGGQCRSSIMLSNII